MRPIPCFASAHTLRAAALTLGSTSTPSQLHFLFSLPFTLFHQHCRPPIVGASDFVQYLHSVLHHIHGTWLFAPYRQSRSYYSQREADTLLNHLLWTGPRNPTLPCLIQHTIYSLPSIAESENTRYFLLLENHRLDRHLRTLCHLALSRLLSTTANQGVHQVIICASTTTTLSSDRFAKHQKVCLSRKYCDNRQSPIDSFYAPRS
jgi:hypothetical protein